MIRTSLLLNSPLELSKLLKLILNITKKVMHAEAATLMLVDEEKGDLFYEVALGEKGKAVKQMFRLKMGQGVAGWVAQHGKPAVIADVAKDPRFFAAVDKKTGFRSRSMICVPLLVEGKVIGILQAINPLHKKSFDAGDLEIFEVFSAQVAVAVAKARWHEKMLHEQKLEQDLNIAREIQKNLLAKEKIEFPAMRFFAKYEPAQTVGGDFYDCFSPSPGKVAVMLGDVSGKGIPAALYMVKTVTEFRSLVPACFPDVGKLSTQLNRSLAEQSTFGMFVTAVILSVDLDTRKIFVANAGHLPPLYISGGDSRAAPVEKAEHLPLGIAPDTDYNAIGHSFKPGDRWLLYSDGLTEARNKTGQEFGVDRLIQSFSQVAKGKKEDGILPLIFDKIKSFNATGAQDDQTAVLVSF